MTERNDQLVKLAQAYGEAVRAHAVAIEKQQETHSAEALAEERRCAYNVEIASDMLLDHAGGY